MLQAKTPSEMTFHKTIFFAFFVFFVYEDLVSGETSQHSLQTDKDSLLEFKKSIKVDPESVLSNWNETTEVCSFKGIRCRNGHRVRRIKLVGTSLVGPFSPVISNLTALRMIDLSDNGLYGNIPYEISSLRHLRKLLLDSNNLEGPIPESLSYLSNLTLLSLGNNTLRGEIPPSLFLNCTSLLNLDLSYNLLIGKIPSEIGNCPKLWNLNLYNNQFTGEIPFSLSNASDMYNLDVEYNNLSGELPSKLVSKLTKLLFLHLSYNHMTSHDHNTNLDIFFTDFKAIVLPFMANGSLDSCLHHHSPVKVIHCDLKPSNVLLNDDLTALVSDFGIAKLVMTIGGGSENMGNFTADMLCGSIGYIAPEYAYGSNTSTKGDVYSFGVLVLEMVTRKRPTDDMFSQGLNLHKWVKSHYHRNWELVVDSSLVRNTREQLPDVKKMWEVAIGELLEMGILCTQDSPSNRPTMLDAADDLDRLKRYLSGDTTATFSSSLGLSSSTISDD